MTPQIIGPGTSQLGRSLPALREGYFNVDEMKFEDLLAMAADYAKILTYYGWDNQPEGNWEPFFASDDAVVNAQVLTTDLGQIESDFSGWLARSVPRFARETEPTQTESIQIPGYIAANRLDSWLRQLQFNQLRGPESSESKQLSDQIAGAIDGKLRDELHSLTVFLEQFNFNAKEEFKDELSGIWFVPNDSGIIGPGIPPPWENNEGRDRIERFLTLNFYSFYHAISLLKTTSRSVLPASLANGAHSPATALYITFLRLFEKVQNKVNRFTERHLDFYYNDVLKAQRQPLVPDSTYLILRPDVAERKALISKGREFLAGIDENNQDLIYTADNDLVVHGARVRELRTLYFGRDPRKSPENQLGFASGAKSNRIPLLSEDAFTKELFADGKESRAWPLFGAPKEYADDDLSEDAGIGFAVASSTLYLKHGERRVSFQFKIEYLAFTPFRVTDFKDAVGLATKLRDGSDLLSSFLREQFSPEHRTLLDQYDGASPLDALERSLVDELNQVLQRELLYDEQRFEPVILTPETQELIEQRPEGNALGRVNRLLLEQAYPDELGGNQYLDFLLEELTESLRFSSREDAFFKAFSQMFTIHLTTESGWLEIPDYLPMSYVVDQDLAADILKIEIRLSPEADPIVSYSPEVHGGNYETDLPLARFLINPNSYLYPYDLLKNIAIKETEINVAVAGVRDVLLYNNLGQLDPNGPFNPFGPLPAVGSYWIIGNAEIARKQITRFDVIVEWAGLPTELGGFEEYYQAYEMPFSESLFEAGVAVLSDGKWLPSEGRQEQRVRLFNAITSENRAAGNHAMRLSAAEAVTSLFKTSQTIPWDDGFGYNSQSKNGFFKFTLADPEQAFGHKEYSQQLTRVLTANASLKHPRLFSPIPNPPYTPLINAVSVDYHAVSTINLARTKSSAQTRLAQTRLAQFRLDERIFHIHPFGLENILPHQHRNILMAPQYIASGNLFIGLSAPELSGTLTLFFHLREDCAPEAGEEPTRYRWSYLTSNRWIELDNARVISDTTDGFLSSGIVTLNLPDDIKTDSTVMPSDLFWLKVSVDDHPEYLCSVYSIQAQALKVTWRQDGNPAAALRGKLPAGTIKEPRVSIPGIDKIDQIVDSFGGSPPESAERVKTRLSERLRHKNRTILPWDYERLILERFPDIFMVKCFSNMVAEPAAPFRRGHVLLVVIPYPKENPAINLKPIVNGLLLSEITDFVEKLSSPFASIKVRNPSYEQIQVRCTVKFREGAAGGYYINALNQAITSYLSPWDSTGGYGAQFGWRIRRNDVETFIRNLGYVELVTNFSMLHIAEDDQSYSHLFDTLQGPVEQEEILPLYAWSIAIPAARHFIEITDSNRPIQAERTGINELRIGSTLIITKENNHGS